MLFFHIFSLRWFPPFKRLWENLPALVDSWEAFPRDLCNYWTLIPPSVEVFHDRRFYFSFRPWKINNKRETKELKALLHNFDCWMSFRFVGKKNEKGRKMIEMVSSEENLLNMERKRERNFRMKQWESYYFNYAKTVLELLLIVRRGLSSDHHKEIVQIRAWNWLSDKKQSCKS